MGTGLIFCSGRDESQKLDVHTNLMSSANRPGQGGWEKQHCPEGTDCFTPTWKCPKTCALLSSFPLLCTTLSGVVGTLVTALATLCILAAGMNITCRNTAQQHPGLPLSSPRAAPPPGAQLQPQLPPKKNSHCHSQARNNLHVKSELRRFRSF